MPKYFTDERPLLFNKATFKLGELTSATLAALFEKSPGNTICLTFEGFEANCLGFLVHVRKSGDRFELLNIAEEVELFVHSEEQLLEVIKHVSGAEYSERAQKAFQQNRNAIGSGVPLGAFSAAP